MSYIHEAALKKAVKQLYMLGSSDRRKSNPDTSGLSNGLGSMVTTGINQQRAQKEKIKQNEEARKKEELAVRDAQVEGQERWGELVEKYGEHAPNTYGPSMHDFTEIQKRVSSNDAAEKARMGGQYTPQGLELAESDANKNAEDRLRAKALIGGQMQMAMQPGMIGIGGTRRGY